MKNETLELNLIKALGKLQHTIIDQEFLDGDSPAVAEVLPEPFFAFHIGQYQFVVNANCFCEVFVDTHIAALPNSPNLLRGLCNLRGVLMPVYQLHQALDASAPKKSIIFCIGKGDQAIGLLVDALPVSLPLRSTERVPKDAVAQPILDSLIDATYFSANKVWNLIDGHTIGELLRTNALQEQQSYPHPPFVSERLLS
jgi:chemotaxis signal transduction protein